MSAFCWVLACFQWALTAGNAAVPVLLRVEPPPGIIADRLQEITVTFSEPVSGVDIDDLLVNDLPVIGVRGADDTYTFAVLQPEYGPVRIRWQAQPGIRDLSEPPLNFDPLSPGATWDYVLTDTLPPRVVDVFPKAGSTISSLSEWVVQFSEPVDGVEAEDLLINGLPALGVESLENGRFIFRFGQPEPGPVLLSWRASHLITDLAEPAGHAFVAESWNLKLDPGSARGDLIINEILAANESGLTDEDSTATDPQPQDWIEIYNRGNRSVNLAGWSLTDDPDQPDRWVFPSRVLNPGAYLVVFASGKDRRSPVGANRFHTNFKLSPRGEFLGLFTPDSPRILADSFSPGYPVQRNDISYGRDTNGVGHYYSQPTPGAKNVGPTIAGLCEDVQFSAPRGHYNAAFTLHLHTPTPAAFIRYTLDGSEPTLQNGQIYTNSLRITNTAVVRAVAFREDRLSSSVGTYTYLFRQSAANRALPILSIVTANKNLTGPTGIAGIGANYQNPDKHGIAWERPTSVEFIRPSDNSGFQLDCGIRIQGSDYTRPRYTSTSKFSYRLYFRGDYGSGRLEQPFFEDSPLAEYDQIVLRAGHNDEVNPFLRDELVRQLSSDLGQVACHGNFVNLFINGVYKGYYNPTERVEEQFLQAYHGGGDKWDILTVGSAVQGGDGVAWTALRNLVNRTNVSLATGYREVARRLDLTNFVDYIFVNAYAATWDWPHNNWRAARERSTNGVFRFYVWDAEGGFLSSRGASFDSFTSSDSALGASSEIADLFNRMKTSPEFRLLFADRVHKHFFNHGALMESNVTSRFVEMRAPLLPVISGFDNGIMTDWIPQRRRFLTTQLLNQKLFASSNAPTLNRFGGRVPAGFELTLKTIATNGVIYYTLNGSDPRVMFSNAVAPGATAYTNPITLTKPVLLQARTLQGTTNWSALTVTSFSIESLASPLRITEIHYNPEGSSALEFIELLNSGDAPVNVGGFSLLGVEFMFVENTIMPGGARWVLASNADTNAFAARYPGVKVAGLFDGSLNNGGERLSLHNRAGHVLVSVDYQDGQGWPVAADGAGASLELIDLNGDPDSPANWAASTARHGTPGQPRTPAPSPVIRINEIMAENVSAVEHGGLYPDWVELQNLGSSPVALDNWSLSDDGDPRKFVFPSGTVIPGGGYLVVWCDDVNALGTGLHSGFSLARKGESLFLYDAATNRIDAVSFGLQISDLTLGLMEGAWELGLPTPGAQNRAAPVADPSQLSINEWMIVSLPGQPGWIELRNRSAEPVSLEGVYLGNSNVISRLAAKSFLPPFGYVQLLANEVVGTEHLDFTLVPRAGVISLYDPSGAELERVRYTGQTNRISQGRYPEDSTNVVQFPNSSSPGAANFLAGYVGPIVNEILARNASLTNRAGVAVDWLELANTNDLPVDLTGMSLSVGEMAPGQWYFPTGTVIAARGYLVIECDEDRPASLGLDAILNCGRSLSGEGGAVHLFNSAGQSVHSFTYGAQLVDRAAGLAGLRRSLLSFPTPGASNSPAAALGSPLSLRLNEWMARPWDGDDWFEIYNLTNLPVDLAGLVLTDDPSAAGTNRFRVGPLTLVDAAGWILWIADGQNPASPGHVNFRLAADGGSLRIYATNGVTLDGIDFSDSSAGISFGRLPDGTGNPVAFPNSESPGERNFQQLNGVVISEVLAEAVPPFERAIELANVSAEPVDVGGWYLSDDRHSPFKYQLPGGAMVSPGGFRVVYEQDWKSAPAPLNLTGARGGEIWLFEADTAGRLTGRAAWARFAPAPANTSFGAYKTGLELQWLPLDRPSFGVAAPSSLEQFRSGQGQSNSLFRVGPIVISELYYHPVSGAGVDAEFIELENVSAQVVDLGSGGSAEHGWRLAEAVSFDFPPGTRLLPGARLVVVDFSPSEQPNRLAAFRSAHGIPSTSTVMGPFQGRLDNAGDDVRLLAPLGAVAAFGTATHYLVDRVDFGSQRPWPEGLVDGGGASLHRRTSSAVGNSPLSWMASKPTPGFVAGAPIQALPVLTLPPTSRSSVLGQRVAFSVVASGPGPLQYQWRFNQQPLARATNALLELDPVRLDDVGRYDVWVGNSGGSILSAGAELAVTLPLSIVDPPQSQMVRGNANSNATFNVVVMGESPLSYQWQFNDHDIPEATSPRLVVPGVTQVNDGRYTVRVSNATGSRSASATLSVVFSPTITLQPQPQTLLVGDTVNLRAAASGTTPMTFRWRKSSSVVSNSVSDSGASTYRITNAKITHSGSYSVLVTNVASSLSSTSITVTVTVLVDTDKDRMPDLWESNNGFSPTMPGDAELDSDQDGMSNRSEYESGTDPRDPGSFLRLDRIAALENGVSISFNALSNRTYSVNYRDDLTSLQWTRLTNVLSRTTNRLETVVDTQATNQSRVYRLVTPGDF
ncbi:MAG: lamin tail domain-containing protein [Verrucomicrobiales bacterium]|nr:lamin tail domain-containing protein [Verrucomicrobiales bacterium]